MEPASAARPLWWCQHGQVVCEALKVVPTWWWGRGSLWRRVLGWTGCCYCGNHCTGDRAADFPNQSIVSGHIQTSCLQHSQFFQVFKRLNRHWKLLQTVVIQIPERKHSLGSADGNTACNWEPWALHWEDIKVCDSIQLQTRNMQHHTGSNCSDCSGSRMAALDWKKLPVRVQTEAPPTTVCSSNRL